MQLNEQEQVLFDQLVPLITASISASEAIAEAKANAKYHKKDNPEGLPAARVSIVATCAKIEAESQFEEYAERQNDIQSTFVRLTGYND